MLEDMRAAVVVLSLADSLREKESWSGETHIQKGVYFLKELVHVPFSYEFVLYRHGPFSFQLRDHLNALRGDGMLDVVPQRPYGPMLRVTDFGREICSRFPRTMREHRQAVEFVADRIARLSVADLERLSTALFVTRASAAATPLERAALINQLKPHIPVREAEEGVRKIDDLIRAVPVT
jgi:uncharacterized protein YwgA